MSTLHILGASGFIGANIARYIRGLPNLDLSISLYGRNDLNLLNPELVSEFFSSIESSDPVLVAAAVSRPPTRSPPHRRSDDSTRGWAPLGRAEYAHASARASRPDP